MVEKQSFLVSIDAGALAYPMRTGIGRHLESVLPPLVDAAGERAQFLLLAGKPLASRTALELVERGLIRAATVNVPSLYAWQQTGMGAQILKHRPDVHFTPDGLLPLLCPTKTVGVLQDVLWKRRPETLAPHLRAVFGLRQKASLKKLDVALTGSRFNTREARRVFGPVADKLAVAPLFGLDHDLFHPPRGDDAAKARAFREKHGIASRFLLCAGNLMPHKNFKAVIRAMIKLWRDKADLPDLVVVGFGDAAAVREALPDGFPAERVKTPGYVADEELVAAYQSCLAFVFPSLYEGYGLPVLEAMACGAPVIYADAASLPEVAGEAGLPFDPHEDDAPARVLADVLERPALRGELREKGLARARNFSWKTGAATLWSALRRAAGRR